MGAGPGDPQLLTLRAKALINRADVIVFTGSLVPKSLLEGSSAEIYDSSRMHLEEVLEILENGHKAGKQVVRLHTGDPSLYSAITEQIRYLREKSIPYKVVPGVTAGFAACASLGIELTIPEKVQTVIMSRVSGRTRVPTRESLKRISGIRGSLILYLSVGHIERVATELSGGYPPHTPVAVVEKATWPAERIVTGNLSDIAQKVQKAGIKKTAVIIVGEAVNSVKGIHENRSKLYDKTFSHEYRKASSEKGKLIRAFSQDTTGNRSEILVVYLGKKGRNIAKVIKDEMKNPVTLVSFKQGREKDIIARKWAKASAVFFICACQIAVRTIAPLLRDKYTDPAVLSIDESGRNVICILSGHIGGGNTLAMETASILGARPIITTQSDLMEITAIDLWARSNNLVPTDKDRLKHMQAIFRDGKSLKVFLQKGVKAAGLPRGLEIERTEQHADIIIGPFNNNVNGGALHLVTRNLYMGTGCHKGLDPHLLLKKAREFLAAHSIHPWAIKNIGTIDKKAGEPAIIELARHLAADLRTFPARELNRVSGVDNSKTVMKAVGAGAVAEPSALLCSPRSSLLVKKKKYYCCTFALAMERVELGKE